jgi:hypothetical protein
LGILGFRRKLRIRLEQQYQLLEHRFHHLFLFLCFILLFVIDFVFVYELCLLIYDCRGYVAPEVVKEDEFVLLSILGVVLIL